MNTASGSKKLGEPLENLVIGGKMAKGTGNEVGLADAIRALRSELGDAVAEGKDQDIRFRLGPIEMEFQLEVENKGSAGGGIKFWVITIGGEVSRSSGTTHRVKLSLQPTGPGGEDIDVSDQVKGRPQ